MRLAALSVHKEAAAAAIFLNMKSKLVSYVAPVKISITLTARYYDPYLTAVIDLEPRPFVGTMSECVARALKSLPHLTLLLILQIGLSAVNEHGIGVRPLVLIWRRHSNSAVAAGILKM